MPKNLGNIKEEIISVTRVMLEDKGYDKLNIRDVAGSCNIGIGTFYNYFKSKHEILSEIIRSDWKEILDDIDKGTESQGDATDKLLFIYSEINKFMKKTHGSGFEEFSNDAGKFDFTMVAEMKKGLRNQLSSRVKKAILGKTPEGKADCYSDLITRLFISYASEGSEDVSELTVLFELILTK